MTQDEIIRMANKAYGIDEEGKPFHPSALLHLEIFAKLVAQHEREACAKYVESLMIGDKPLTTVMGALGEAIRARGQA